MEHTMVKFLLINRLVNIVSSELKIPLKDARNKVYFSGVTRLIEDDATELYSDSALNIYYQYKDRILNTNIWVLQSIFIK